MTIMLAAGPVLKIEVDMVAVMAVGTGAENRHEIGARFTTDKPQETSFIRAA